MTGATPRPRPCATCPYRQSVPSGVWHEEEYVKLERYDGDTATQNPAAFACHQGDGSICSGWLGHRDPADLLAVRLGVLGGQLDSSCISYTTDVPLFDSGRAAAEHGRRDMAAPAPAAVDAMDKIVRRRGES